MGSSANVRSIAALDEMNTALKRFQNEATSALNAADMDIKRTFEWLQERRRYWQYELKRHEQALIEAQRALQACMRSGDREHPPDCRENMAAVARLQRMVQEAGRELQIVEIHIKRVGEAAQHYQSVARRLASTLNGELLQGSTFLSNRANTLYAYASSGGGTPSSFSSGNNASRGESAFSGSQALPQVGGASAGKIGNTQHQMIAIADIDLSDSHVKAATDFKKVAPDQMKDGFHKLQSIVLPAVAQGADDDYFARLDASQGLENANGYSHIYHVFFSDPDSIRLSNMNGRLTVVNGFHRIYIAQQLGITHLPARVFSSGQP